METKNCQSCGQKLLGRNDKKFCDDQCRSAFNNKINSRLNKEIRQVDQVLKKNRKILAYLYVAQQEEKFTIYKRKIQELGFVFDFHTQIQKTKQGKTCVICYDYGYIALNPMEFAIIKMK